MTLSGKFLVSLAVLFSAALCSATVSAQVITSSKDAEGALSAEFLRNSVEFYSDSLCEGRSSASRGIIEAGFHIAREFDIEGLVPFGESFSHSFKAGEVTGHNLIGMLAGKDSHSNKYILVISHYDGIGVLNGQLYPGADSNASGIAAMTGIGRMFRYMRDHGREYNCNVIFAALDCNSFNNAGAKELWDEIKSGSLTDPVSGGRIKAGDIKLVVNMDIIGSSLSPLDSGREDFLIMLGGNSFRKTLVSANDNYNTNLELSFDYYGSKDFTDMFLKRIGDHTVFLDNGMESVLFTSGITMSTNKTSDTAGTIRYEVLRKRAILIFHWLERVISQI